MVYKVRRCIIASYKVIKMKDTSITIKMSEEMKENLQALAIADRRTLSDFIRLELEKIIAQNPKK